MPKLIDLVFGLRNVIVMVALLLFGEGLLAWVIGWAGFSYPADFMVNLGLWVGLWMGIGFTIRLLPVDGKGWTLGGVVGLLFVLLLFFALFAYRLWIGDPLALTFVQAVIAIFGYTLLGLFSGLVSGIRQARAIAGYEERF